MTTLRWTFTDPTDASTYTVPINPNAMSPVGVDRTLRRTRGQHGVVSIHAVPSERAFEFSGVIRTQDHYDALYTWVNKRVPVVVTDHLARTFRVYLTDFIPVDRSPTAKALKRWTYTVKGKLLEGPM